MLKYGIQAQFLHLFLHLFKGSIGKGSIGNLTPCRRSKSDTLLDFLRHVVWYYYIILRRNVLLHVLLHLACHMITQYKYLGILAYYKAT